MPKTAVISQELETALLTKDIRKNELGYMTNTPKTTISGHVSGGNLKAEKAIEYSDAINDDLLKSQISYQYVGFIKAMDGKISEVLTPTELEVMQESEAKERKQHREQAKDLLLKHRVEALTQEDKAHLEMYVMEFLDEIVIEISLVFSILKIIGMSITEAMHLRMPHWITKKIMKG